MPNQKRKSGILVFGVLIWSLFSSAVQAAPVTVRWTGKDDPNSGLAHVLEVLQAKTGFALKEADFVKLESRDLARYQYVLLAQTAAGVPLKGRSLRIWTDLKTGQAVQVEAQLESPAVTTALRDKLMRTSMRLEQTASGEAGKLALPSAFQAKVLKLAQTRIAQNADDSLASDLQVRDEWNGRELVRLVSGKGRRGKHFVSVSLLQNKIFEYRYEPFPQFDPNSTGEFSIPAKVFAIYEETDKGETRLPLVPAELKYLKKETRRTDGDPYAPLRSQRYLEDKYDPVLAETEEGRKLGFWSSAYIKRQAAAIRGALPLTSNTFESGRGVVLDGRYATVSLHPAVTKVFTGLKFTPQFSTQFRGDWVESESGLFEYIPNASLLGRPLADFADAWSRPVRRLENHDPVEYINDGFDELQVYYSINTFMDSLHDSGFVDPDLSTRPFNAFLYDPDISMKDNAYYTDDTINFTTYSPKAQNYARDNSTIWHELGHGIMDRLMGDYVQLADTGGLSEGMADFLAALVIEDVTDGRAFPGSDQFRIKNQTAFFVTNEVHDDGEAYGGAMHDFMQAAIEKFSQSGLQKATDLTLDAMRLTRNHPALTAQDWFNHMLFADELGSDLRKPGELGDLIRKALAGRNFSLDGAAPASFSLKNVTDGTDLEVVAGAPGSRQTPIRVDLGESETKQFEIAVKLTNTETYQFKFPVQVRVGLRGGPIQGAVHWVGEESEPLVLTLNAPGDELKIPLTVSGKCDQINRDDGSCVDFAYVQIFNQGEASKPQAKKRFYLRVKAKAAS